VEALCADTHLLFDSQARECREVVGAQLIAPVWLAADESPVDTNLGAMNRAPTSHQRHSGENWKPGLD